MSQKLSKIRKKFLNESSVKVEEIKESKSKAFPVGKMFISSPKLINEQVLKIPKGKIATMGQLRDELAFNHQADYTCPLTTGIFARVVAEAAEEDRSNGVSNITPWWRLVADDGKLNLKYPGEGNWQKQLLEEEGIKIVSSGKSGFKIADLPTYKIEKL